MSNPITPQQLAALERVVDKVFANIGIDVEFTRHFLDRVNDERNRKQITIRELGELFAKEYKRWGREIAKMPIDAQAVMKDLSSELNIPFVLNPDGKEKDLVAKTVMRKKNFRTPNKELPVESVEESDGKSLNDIVWAKNVIKPGSKREMPKDKLEPGTKVKYAGGVSTVVSQKDGLVVLSNPKWSKNRTVPLYSIEVESKVEEKHGAKRGKQVKGRSATPKKTKPSKSGQQPHPMRGKLVGEETVNEISDKKVKKYLKKARKDMDRSDGAAQAGRSYAAQGGKDADYWNDYAQGMQQKYDKRNKSIKRFRGRVEEEQINEVGGGKVVATVNGYPIHDMGAAYPHKDKRFLIRDPNIDVWQASAPTLKAASARAENLKPAVKQEPKTQAQIDHDDWRDEQRARIDRGDVRRAVMSRRGLGEADDESFVRTFVKDKRREGWTVYHSRINHGVQGAHRFEFERDGQEFEIVGRGDRWELFRDGPTLSGRGEEFDGLDSAFQTATDMNEAMDEPPLDAPTLDVDAVANKHGVDRDKIEQQLKMGIEVEMEHTTDALAAREIALDHLMELPDYYDKLATIEPHHFTPESVLAAWESYQVDEKIRDPREAMLDMALKFLDRKVRGDKDQQSLGGHAYEVAREVNLNQIGVNYKELANLYRDWKGDSVVTEGWIEENLYYLDEVINTADQPKKKRRK